MCNTAKNHPGFHRHVQETREATDYIMRMQRSLGLREKAIQAHENSRSKPRLTPIELTEEARAMAQRWEEINSPEMKERLSALKIPKIKPCFRVGLVAGEEPHTKGRITGLQILGDDQPARESRLQDTVKLVFLLKEEHPSQPKQEFLPGVFLGGDPMALVELTVPDGWLIARAFLLGEDPEVSSTPPDRP